MAQLVKSVKVWLIIPPRGEIVLVIAGASEEEAVQAACSSILSIDDLAQLAVRTAQNNNVRIKEAITQVVADNPLPDGSFMSRKDVYARVLDMKNSPLIRKDLTGRLK